MGGREIAPEDDRLVIIFTKSNLSQASENSLIFSLLGELHSIHFNNKKRLKRKSICIDPLSGFIQKQGKINCSILLHHYTGIKMRENKQKQVEIASRGKTKLFVFSSFLSGRRLAYSLSKNR